MKKPKATKTPADHAPMCELCDPPRRHWSRDPHKFASKKKAGKVTKLR